MIAPRGTTAGGGPRHEEALERAERAFGALTGSAAPPAVDRRGVARAGEEAEGGIELGDEGGRHGDAQLHAAVLAASASFCLASSSVPTM